jgi:fructoselysine-6-P-deglycase FrlB-like protein
MTNFDPRAPLAGAADPWASLPAPSLRAKPPYHMTEMIAAEPVVAERLLDDLADHQGPASRLAGAIGQAATSGGSIIVTGCGTSEHGAQGVALIVRDALRAGGLPSGPTAILAAQAFELALDPPSGGLVIGVSHEGATEATIRALEASAQAGARTGLITASAGAPAAAASSPELVLDTVELDHSWCHTIGYLSPLLAGAAIGAHLTGDELDPESIRDLLETRRARSASRQPSVTHGRCWWWGPAPTGQLPASSRSRSKRRRGCRPRCEIWRPSSTATCRQRTDRPAWS